MTELRRPIFLAALLSVISLFLVSCETVQNVTQPVLTPIFGPSSMSLEFENPNALEAPSQTRVETVSLLQDRLDHTPNISGEVSVATDGTIYVDNLSFSHRDTDLVQTLLTEPQALTFHLTAHQEEYDWLIESQQDEPRDGFMWMDIPSATVAGTDHPQFPERLLVQTEPVLTGGDLKEGNAYTPEPEGADGDWWVRLEFHPNAEEKLQQITSENVGQKLVINWGGSLLAAPNIDQALSGDLVRIEGALLEDEAKVIASLVNIPPLPARLTRVE